MQAHQFDHPARCCADCDRDAIVLVTEWNQYRGLNLDKMRSLMSGNVFIDLRNVYEPDLMKKHGFLYTCIGRGT